MTDLKEKILEYARKKKPGYTNPVSTPDLVQEFGELNKGAIQVAILQLKAERKLEADSARDGLRITRVF